jgi:hypothetical protein
MVTVKSSININFKCFFFMIPVISSNKTEFEFFSDSFGSEFTLKAVRHSVLPVTFDPTASLKIKNVSYYLIPF